MRQNLSLWEKALTDVLHQTVKFDESGVFLAEMEQQLINFHYQDAMLVIYACAGQLEDSAQACKLLRANCFWKGTKGATLSMLDDDTVILAFQCSIQNKASLNQQLTDFLVVLNYWAAQLSATENKTGSGHASPASAKQSKDNSAESRRWLSIDLL